MRLYPNISEELFEFPVHLTHIITMTVIKLIIGTLVFSWALLCFATGAYAAPLRLLVIGDSLSEEYRFEAPFSAPDSNPLQANTRNWVEILAARRPSFFSLGGYQASLGSYADLRNAGYEYNYSIPGYKASAWVELLNNPGLNLPRILTRLELNGDLGSVNAVLIVAGANDLRLGDTDAQHNVIRTNLVSIHSYVRANAPAGIPIIVGTVADIGATPLEKISDPTTAAASRQRVATLNANIISDLGARPNTFIARIDRITDRIYDQVPFHINGTEFTYAPHPENPPRHLFCKDGFHPSTVCQALIANEILKGINHFAATPIPLLTNREILGDVLSLNPDQPLIDFISAAGDDHDGLPALLEFLLGTNPSSPSVALTFSADGSASYRPSPSALRFANLSLLQSQSLNNDWVPVPAANTISFPDGSVKIIPSSPTLFYKFAATPNP